MEHETFTQESCSISQQSSLLLTRELRYLFGPSDEFEVLVVLTEAHQLAEEVEILFALSVALARNEMLEFEQVAIG